MVGFPMFLLLFFPLIFFVSSDFRPGPGYPPSAALSGASCGKSGGGARGGCTAPCWPTTKLEALFQALVFLGVAITTGENRENPLEKGD